MDAKILIALLIAINCYSSCGAALRRTPKVYNALITTDENLTSSRAFPVIQPTIHESGVAHYPFGPYSPYGSYYTPPLVRFGQPIVPGLAPNQQFPYRLPQQRFPPQFVQQQAPNSGPQTVPTSDAAAQQPSPQEASPEESAAPTAAPPTDEQQPVQPPTLPPPPKTPSYIPPLEQNPPKQMPNEKLPIPLNEYGFPPSLIPLQPYPNRRAHNGPLSIPPYGFNQYPLIYDPITGYREQYLPPYDYFPSQYQHFSFDGGVPVSVPKPSYPPTPAPSLPPAQPEQQSSQEPSELAAASEPKPQPEPQPEESSPQLSANVDFESIKNASKNKNSAVPDVPPPPIPSGAKTQES